MMGFLAFLLLAAPPAHYVEEWKAAGDDDCGRLLFLAQRLEHHRYSFSPRDIERIAACEKKLFPSRVANLRVLDRNVAIGARTIMAHHETPARVYLPAGVWFIGFVPYLRPYVQRLHAQLPAGAAPGTDFSFGIFVRRDSFWIETREHPSSGPAHPHVRVTFDEARAVCRKLGGDLPDEEQWEIAARGASYYRMFPFGESIPPACFGQSGDVCGARRESGDISPWGVWNMGSSVAEWVLASPRQSAVPAGMAVTRGGSSRDPYFWNLVAVRRIVSAQTRSDAIGFRCVWPGSHRSDAR